MSELRDALDAIYMHQPALRQIVYDEIVARERSEAAARGEKSIAQAERHHADRQWWTRFSVAVAAASFLLALASFLLGRYFPTSQVTALELRVSAIEHKMSTSPQSTQLIPPLTPPPTTSQTISAPYQSSTPVGGTQQPTIP